VWGGIVNQPNGAHNPAQIPGSFRHRTVSAQLTVNAGAPCAHAQWRTVAAVHTCTKMHD